MEHGTAKCLSAAVLMISAITHLIWSQSMFAWGNKESHPEITARAVPISALDEFVSTYLRIDDGVGAELECGWYVAEFWIKMKAAGKYAEILGALGTDAQDYGDGMGPMILSSATPEEANYEMQYQDGQNTYLFPVTFMKDDEANWRIFNF